MQNAVVVCREILADDMIVRRSRGLLRISGSVTVDYDSSGMRWKAAVKLLASLQRAGVAQNDLVQDVDVSVDDLRDHRTHRIYIEVQCPQERRRRANLKIPYVLFSAECIVDQAGLHVEVFSQRFLLIEGFVVTAFQQVVEVWNLLQKILVFKRLGERCVVASQRF